MGFDVGTNIMALPAAPAHTQLVGLHDWVPSVLFNVCVAVVVASALSHWHRCVASAHQHRKRSRELWAKLARWVNFGGSLSPMTIKSPPVLKSAHNSAAMVMRPAALRKPIKYISSSVYASKIDGFLIDLDGTMYNPDGLIPGALDFHEWLVRTGKPFVYLSNTGGKNSLAVQRKFLTPPFALGTTPLPLYHIHTASEAQVDLLLDNVPYGAKLLVIANDCHWKEDLCTRRGAAGAALVDSWEIRTSLSEDEAKRWACAAAISKSKVGANDAVCKVWVCFFHDGPIATNDAESKGAFSDWSFEMIKFIGFLLAHGAQFCYTAPDAYNPSVCSEHPGVVFPLPGPGMFAGMLKELMYPNGRNNFWCAGKGGNLGTRYMLECGVQQLVKQGHSGEKNRIMMVGDRYDTDVSGGLMAGVRTCLVLSGCHSLEDAQHYPDMVAHFTAASVGCLHPPEVQPQISRASHLSRPLLPALDCELELPSDVVPPQTPEPRSQHKVQSWVLAHSNLLFSPSYTEHATPSLRQCIEEDLANGQASEEDGLDAKALCADGIDGESLGILVPHLSQGKQSNNDLINEWSDRLLEWEERVQHERYSRRKWRSAGNKLSLPSLLGHARMSEHHGCSMHDIVNSTTAPQ